MPLFWVKDVKFVLLFFGFFYCAMVSLIFSLIKQNTITEEWHGCHPKNEQLSGRELPSVDCGQIKFAKMKYGYNNDSAHTL